MNRISNAFRQNFLAGLIVTVPFGLTVFILFTLGKWIVELLSAAPAKVLIRPLSQLHPSLFQLSTFGIGLVGTIIIVLFVGSIARFYTGRKLLGIGESIIARIPLARTIYTASKQVIESIFLTTGFKGVKRVVMFEYPRKGVYSIGFVTGTIKDDADRNTSGRNLVGIFVPTTPNPTSGYYIMLPEEDIKELPISTEDAFRIIISGGLADNQSKDVKSNK
ncbi:MAG: DUF502 domain-containing protein [Thermodesulfobacteriota bacterium]